VRDALKGKGLGVFWGHGGKEKTQGGLNILAVDAVIFLVGQPTAVIYHAIEHEQGTTATVLHPHRRLDVFEIGRTQIEMPTLIAVLCLEANGRRLLQERWVVVAPAFEVAIDRGLRQERRWRLHMALRRLHPVGFHEPNGFRGGEMTAVPIGGPKFERGNEFTIAFELCACHDPRLAAVGTVEGAWTQTVSEYPIQGVFRHPIELRRVTHELAPLRTAGRQHA